MNPDKSQEEGFFSRKVAQWSVLKVMCDLILTVQGMFALQRVEYFSFRKWWVHLIGLRPVSGNEKSNEAGQKETLLGPRSIPIFSSFSVCAHSSLLAIYTHSPCRALSSQVCWDKWEIRSDSARVHSCTHAFPVRFHHRFSPCEEPGETLTQYGHSISVVYLVASWLLC